MPKAKFEPEPKRASLASANRMGAATLDPAIVAQLAHSYWEARGCQGGSPEEDWYRAEQELSGRLTQAASN